MDGNLKFKIQLTTVSGYELIKPNLRTVVFITMLVDEIEVRMILSGLNSNKVKYKEASFLLGH